MKDKISELRPLMVKWDPCSLIEVGAPAEEYDDVLETILEFLSYGQASQESLEKQLIAAMEKQELIYLNELKPPFQEKYISDIKELANAILKLNI